jgi:translation initiation factor 1
MADKNRIVYSTDPNWKDNKQNSSVKKQPPSSGQLAYIERDRKNRKGKTVTVISGLSGNLKELLKELQKQCGAGGSLKQNIIEIQGDHRDKIAGLLQTKGFRVKFRGG